MYSDVRKLIKQATIDGFVDFAQYGDGVDEKWIDKAEKHLGFKLPSSYKWWLLNYGGGEVNGEEIYSIYELDFDTVVGGDITYIYNLYKNDPYFGSDKLVISNENDRIFYFDLAQKSEGDIEYPVYSYFENERYADTFVEFLKKRILELY